MLLQILQRTPPWVFALFAVLLLATGLSAVHVLYGLKP
mgnify:CR=1 FL=1